jgi:RNA polymerase sigma factor (sigma-70 family)
MEEDRIDLIRAGDSAEFAELFRRSVQPVYRWCARSADDGEAEDLLSIVFLEAWRTRERAFLVEASALPWLLGIATNVIRSQRRLRRRYRATLERFHDTYPVVEAAGDGTDQNIAKLDGPAISAALFAAINSLDSRHAAVAHLCLIEGLSPTAASAALGVSASTVRSRLATARQRLQRLLRTSEILDGWLPGDHSLSESPVRGASARTAERTGTP